MPQEREIQVTPHIQVPVCISRREELLIMLTVKKFPSFPHCIFEPTTMNLVLSRLSYNLFADNPLLTSSKQFFNLSKA